MSLSQLLTISKSHGFGALVQLAIWIIGQLAQLGRGLWKLPYGSLQFARMDVNGGPWLDILFGDIACEGTSRVLWVSDLERRGALQMRCRRYLHWLRFGSPSYCPAIVYVRQTCEPGFLQFRS